MINPKRPRRQRGRRPDRGRHGSTFHHQPVLRCSDPVTGQPLVFDFFVEHGRCVVEVSGDTLPPILIGEEFLLHVARRWDELMQADSATPHPSVPAGPDAGGDSSTRTVSDPSRQEAINGSTMKGPSVTTDSPSVVRPILAPTVEEIPRITRWRDTTVLRSYLGTGAAGSAPRPAEPETEPWRRRDGS